MKIVSILFVYNNKKANKSEIYISKNKKDIYPFDKINICFKT